MSYIYCIKQPSCVILLCLQKSLTKTNCARKEIKVKKKKRCRRNRPLLKRSSCGGGDSFSPQLADVLLALFSSSSLNTSLSAQPASRTSKTLFQHGRFSRVFQSRVARTWTMWTIRQFYYHSKFGRSLAFSRMKKLTCLTKSKP